MITYVVIKIQAYVDSEVIYAGNDREKAYVVAKEKGAIIQEWHDGELVKES